MRLNSKIIVCLMLLFSLGGSLLAAATPFTTKKALLVIAPKDFHDEEYSIPRGILEAKGIKVTVASTVKNPTGMFGKKLSADILLKDVKAADYDAVVFIGGNGATIYENDPQAIKLAKDAVEQDKILGAICIAPVILAKAGALKGITATGSPYGTGTLKSHGAKYTGRELEVDGKIITGKGPASAKKFGEAILRALQLE